VRQGLGKAVDSKIRASLRGTIFISLLKDSVDKDSSVNALLFDIGQVIIRVDPLQMATAFARRIGKEPEALLRDIEKDPALRDFQEGRLAPEQWHEHLSRRLGRRLPFQEFCTAWNQALREPLLDEDLFAQLRQRYRLLLLSNTDPIHGDYMDEAYGFLQYFPIHLFSHTLGASKPSDVVYERAIAAAGVKPERILYIDDVPAYGQR